MRRDIVVVGASAGGFEVLKTLVSQLPLDFPAAVLVVWHMMPQSPSILADILSRHGPLPAKQAVNGEAIEPGHIYVARPDHHLMVESGQVWVTHGPKENRFRPSVDVLFRSAAVSYGRRAIGVVLTGSLDDGASGLFAIKERGGVAVVQDPVEAPYYDMPIYAMKSTVVDYVLPVAAMGSTLLRLVNEPLMEQEERPVSDIMATEVRIAREDHALDIGVTRLGEPSIFTCPECHGTLLQIKEGRHLRFRCHTGHAFSLNSLLVEVTKSIEDALWNGVRVIEESQMLLTHMATHLQEGNQSEAATMFLRKAERAHQQAELIRQAAMNNEILSQEELLPPENGSPPTD